MIEYIIIFINIIFSLHWKKTIIKFVLEIKRVCCLQCWFCSHSFEIIQCFFALIACFLAWFIPKRIMWHQAYSDLIRDYRSYDFGVAVQGIVEFFTEDCKSDIDNIKLEYETRFQNEVSNDKIKTMAPQLCLHYQRRLLAQFFYQLDLCSRTIFVGKKRILKDFTKNEANIIQILYLINNAIEESDIIKKDISCEFSLSAGKGKGLNRWLSHIYSLLKNNSRHMGGF